VDASDCARLVGRQAWREGCALLSSLCLTSVLLFDDLFLLHELVFPRHFGIPQEAVLIGYDLPSAVTH
jgi:hypothetical protein